MGEKHFTRVRIPGTVIYICDDFFNAEVDKYGFIGYQKWWEGVDLQQLLHCCIVGSVGCYRDSVAPS